MSRIYPTQKWFRITLVGLSVACGTAKKKEEETTSSTTTTTAAIVDKQTPDDSTGATGSLSLTMNRPASGSSLWGDDVTGDGLQLADLSVDTTVTLKVAKLAVASVRFKGKKDQSNSEKALEKSEEKQIEAQKKVDEAQLESLKATKEQEKELASITSAEEKSKKQAEYDKKKGELKKKQVEAAKEAEKKLAELEESDKNQFWKGPYVYDMVAGTMTPSLDDVQVADGSYRRVEFKLKPYRSGETTDPLLNNSIYISGTAVVGGVSKSFEFTIHNSENFRLSGDKIKIDANSTNKVAINLDPTLWFSGIDFSKATANSDGTITIDDQINKDLWKAIRRNIKKSVICGRDVRGDGRIKSAESGADSREFSKSEEESGK